MVGIELQHFLENCFKDFPIRKIVCIDQVPRHLKVSSFQNQDLWALVGAFWPGPLTAILPNPSPSMSLIASEKNTIAVRCPDNDLVRRIANDLGPLAATSANIHGEDTPENATEIAAMLPNVDLIVDGGPLKDGLASTLVDLTQPVPQIIREGPITEKMIFDTLD